MRILTFFILIFNLLTAAQTVPIIFRVNMSYQVSEQKFNPTTEFVDIAGTFNNWGSQVMALSDPDGDLIYERTVTGFTVASTIEFKFRINGAWNGREEFPGGGPNRSYIVRSDSNIVEVWYNDELPPTGPPVAGFTANSRTLFSSGTVNFKSLSSGVITEYKWIFEGGTPSISTERNPVVYYSAAGFYGVTLVVSNETESDTLNIPDYIEVKERDFSGPGWWNDKVFYEIFVRSFYDSNGDGIGDFKGLTAKLDYLNDGDPETGDDLGITGIWLMPINPSPSYHGYDVSDYRGIKGQYGTMNDFKEFIAAAHQRGIKVIIDYVINHSSTQHYWFQQSAANNPIYRNFYRWSPTHPGIPGPFGNGWHSSSSGYYYGAFWSGMPDLNYENPAVKDSIFSIASYWLNEVGIDGFRLDAVLYIVEEGNIVANAPGTFQILSEFTSHIKSAKPESFAVGEAWTNSETVVNYVNNNVLDYCFEFDLASATLNALKTGGAGQLISQMQKVYNIYPHLQYGTFLTNHDQNRLMSELQSVEKVKAAAALYLTFPGIPYLYYGEEIGMTGVKPDENIRTPMQWTGGQHSGFTTGTPWRQVNGNYPTVNVSSQLADSLSLLNWYRKLIALRNKEVTLRLGEYESLVASESSVMSYFRHYGGKTIMVIVNTSGSAVGNLSLKVMAERVPSGTYQGTNMISGISYDFTINSNSMIEDLSMAPYGTLIIGFENGIGEVGEPGVISEFRLEQNYPNPFNPSTVINFTLPEAGNVELKVFNILGSEIKTLVSEYRGAGRYSETFNGGSLASGVYFYRLTTLRGSLTGKMMLVR